MVSAGRSGGRISQSEPEVRRAVSGHCHRRQGGHGLGGVGKTRLAVEYAWQHAEQFSAVLFVTTDTPATLRQNLAELTGPQKNDRGRHILPTDQSDAQCIARELADYLAKWKSLERKVQTLHDRTMNYSKPIDIT